MHRFEVASLDIHFDAAMKSKDRVLDGRRQDHDEDERNAALPAERLRSVRFEGGALQGGSCGLHGVDVQGRSVRPRIADHLHARRDRTVATRRRHEQHEVGRASWMHAGVGRAQLRVGGERRRGSERASAPPPYRFLSRHRRSHSAWAFGKAICRAEPTSRGSPHS